MSEEKVVEHHWHEPTQGQVIKAMYQYLADAGVDNTKLQEIVEKKIAQAVAGSVDRWVNSGKFNESIINAVAHYVQNEKQCFDRTYGWSNRLRDLIQQELQKQLTSGFEVKVIPR